MRKISVCIITKNESEKLKKCLKQLMGYGFEIVVVDTGSTDDTVVMAKKYADKVCYFSWCNDFSAARNYALTLASNDIVMMIDSDEYLQEIDTGELENLLKQHPSMVGRIKRINRVSVERGVLNPNHQKSRAHRLKMAALRYCQSYLYSLLAYRPQCCNK